MSEDYKNNPVYNDYSDYLKNKLCKPGLAKLTTTKPISQFDGDIKFILQSMYDSRDEVIERMASIFNAIYTQQNHVFLIAKTSVNDLVKEDINHTHQSCNTETYKDIMRRLFTSSVIIELEKAEQRRKGVAGKAGLYELIDPKYLNPLILVAGRDVCMAKKDQYLKWYRTQYKAELEYLPKEEVKPKLPKTEFELEIERRVNAKLAGKRP